MALHYSESSRKYLPCKATPGRCPLNGKHYPNIWSELDDPLLRDRVEEKLVKLRRIAETRDGDKGYIRAARHLDKYYRFNENGDYVSALIDLDEDKQLEIVNNPKTPRSVVYDLRYSTFPEVSRIACKKEGLTPQAALSFFDKNIKGREYVMRSDGSRLSTSAGRLFETLFGLDESKVPGGQTADADLGEVELKTYGTDRPSPLVLTTLNSTAPAVLKRHLKKEGFLDGDNHLNLRMNSWERFNDYEYRLGFSENRDKIHLLIRDANGVITKKENVYWDAANLKDRIHNKLSKILVAICYKEYLPEEDALRVVFKKAKLGGFSYDNFVKNLEQGKVVISVFAGFEKKEQTVRRLQTRFKSTLGAVLDRD